MEWRRIVTKKWLLIGVAAFSIGAKKSDVLPVGQPMTANDKATGAKAHPEIMKEFGDPYEGAQSGYVRSVGQKIAVQSGLSNAQGDFTVTLLNSPVDNAFAIPGGYVYVTRQLLALMNNEAELASVLGHEVGHVAARHSAQRQKKATLGGLGAILATVAGAAIGGSDGAKLGQQLGGNLATRYVLGFSRAQEYQADDLGVSYIFKAGYDPKAASTMLASLAAQTALDARVAGRGESSLPKWASTHPDPASRVARAAQKAAATGSTSQLRNESAFLSALDGVMYGDDPKQGVVDGRTFRHPDLKLGFTAPTGFAISNGTSSVTISGSTGNAEFTGMKFDGNLTDYVKAVFKAVGGGQNTPNFGEVSRTDINGIPAAYASANAQNQSGQQLTVTVYAYEFAPDSRFHIVGITQAGSASTLSPLFQSVRRLSAQEAAAVKPRRIDVVTVKSSDTVQKLSERMAYDDNKLDRFLVLNALTSNSTLKAGQRVKTVIYGQ
jgi:predicted Zn-dependent protease